MSSRQRSLSIFFLRNFLSLVRNEANKQGSRRPCPCLHVTKEEIPDWWTYRLCPFLSLQLTRLRPTGRRWLRGKHLLCAIKGSKEEKRVSSDGDDCRRLYGYVVVSLKRRKDSGKTTGFTLQGHPIDGSIYDRCTRKTVNGTEQERLRTGKTKDRVGHLWTSRGWERGSRGYRSISGPK